MVGCGPKPQGYAQKNERLVDKGATTPYNWDVRDKNVRFKKGREATMIPNKLYSKTMEDEDIWDFCNRIQNIHDHHPSETYLYQFEELAKKYNLTLPII